MRVSMRASDVQSMCVVGGIQSNCGVAPSVSSRSRLDGGKRPSLHSPRRWIVDVEDGSICVGECGAWNSKTALREEDQSGGTEGGRRSEMTVNSVLLLRGRGRGVFHRERPTRGYDRIKSFDRVDSQQGVV